MKIREFWVTLKQCVSDIVFHWCVLGLRRSRQRPRHIAFIVDGNRTFSRERGIPLFEAYVKGMDTIEHQIELSQALGGSTLSFYLFSTHNNRRSGNDKRDVLAVIEIFLKKLVSNTRGYRYEIIGDLLELPVPIRSLCDQLTRRAKLNEGGIINLAINYSGRTEMVDVTRRLLRQPRRVVNETAFDNLVYTSTSTKPNIIIRTSGQRRLSDFLLWQSDESLLYFTNRRWPEFSRWCLLKAVFHYQIFSRSCRLKEPTAETRMR